jgi:hypothetical protein
VVGQPKRKLRVFTTLLWEQSTPVAGMNGMSEITSRVTYTLGFSVVGTAADGRTANVATVAIDGNDYLGYPAQSAIKGCAVLQLNSPAPLLSLIAYFSGSGRR